MPHFSGDPVARDIRVEHRTAPWIVARHGHCEGHDQQKKWRVREWPADQHLADYNHMNDLWVDMDSRFRRNPWGAKGLESPALRMAFMACFNVDTFRSFVFESTFLSRFNIPESQVRSLETDDIAMMNFGFAWVRYFLTGQAPLEETAA